MKKVSSQIKRSLFSWMFIILAFISTTYGQENETIKSYYQGQNWYKVVSLIRDDYKIKLYFDPDIIPDFTFKVASDKQTLIEALKENLNPYNIKISKYKHSIFLTPDQSIKTSLAPDFFKAIQPEPLENSPADNNHLDGYLNTNKDYISKNIVVGDRKKGIGKTTVTLNGTIISSDDNSPIINGTIYFNEIEEAVVTNEKGFYSITLAKGTYTATISSIESEEQKLRIQILSDGTLDIALKTKMYLLDEIVVNSDRKHNVRGSQMGFERIDTKKIKEIPVVLGERDLIKVALLLPGVQSVGEGTSGFNVRGSPVDQNLFYINRVPVYNTSHLFGFFSSFNADAISEFTLLKSNIPEKFGGRLSSIFDISAKEGNKEKFSMRGGLSPITSSLLLESPIVKDKSSFLFSARSTYSNWILGLVDDPSIRNSKAYFGDAIANFSFKLNPKNDLKLFSYYSYDNATIAGLTKYIYKNSGASLLWHHNINDKHFFDLSLSSARYGLENDNLEYEFASYHQSFDLSHDEVRANLYLNPSKEHQVTIGINSILYGLGKGDFLPLNENSFIERKSFESEKGTESAIYIGDAWKINDDLEISAGFRFNYYAYLGPKTVFTYLPGLPREEDYIVDTLSFGKNKKIADYSGIDYRIATKYLINENLSVKASYNRLHQYIFMLSNTIAVSPTDSWKLSDSHIKPMEGDQYSAGIYTNILANFLEFSVEGYYKTVQNLVEYKDGAELVFASNAETEIVQGDLDAWGLEFMLRKPSGKLNGWVNYTYSSADVLVNNIATGEQNNFGYSYPANYDKPHAFNLVANYRFSKRLSFSGNIVYSTGRPITYPTAIYYQNGMEITNYSLRNEYRLPDYFRIDASINFEGNLKRNKLFHGSWAFSVYNLNGRKNAYSVYFKSENGIIKGYKLSIFGVPIFSITYNFKLGNYAN
ncbi:MAG: TonB-dependent receptor [Bacteroidales bacterium]|nr:TonB-dependent receptor [Bacteroidales bacterium]MCF8403306.1 TonB-dependent receptor [Bacteroidales bacterium]